jgi:serine/threonine protein kinase
MYTLYTHAYGLTCTVYTRARRLLEFDPARRISAREALQHQFFDISDAEDCLDSLSPSPVPPCITMATPSHPVNLPRNSSSGSQSDVTSDKCAPKSDNTAKEWSDYQVITDEAVSEPKSHGQIEALGAGHVMSRTTSSDIGSSADTVIRDDTDSSNHVHYNSSCGSNPKSSTSESRVAGAPPQPQAPPRRAHAIMEKHAVAVASGSDNQRAISSGQTKVTVSDSDRLPMRPAAMHEVSEASRYHHTSLGRSQSSENARNKPQQESEDVGASKRPSSERITTTSGAIATAQSGNGKNFSAMVRGAKGVAREL